MRAVAAIVLLAGCGRVDFDSLTGGRDAGDVDADADAGSTGSPNFGPCVEGDFRLERDGICYSRHDTAQSYTGAAERCASIGATLATFATPAESDIAFTLMSDTPLITDAWIGLDDRAIEGEHRWASGEPMASTQWASGEPNSENADEDCVETYQSGLWNDTGCSWGIPYLCERRMVQQPCVEGDERIEITGRCYFRFTGVVNRAMAVERCALSNAHLASITSMEENDAVASIIDNEDVWLGLSDEVTEGTYAWSTGEPLTFTNWQPEEPNDDGGIEDCVEMVEGGLWNDYECPVSDNEALCERP